MQTDHLAARLDTACDTMEEAVYIAEAIRHAMASEAFKTCYGTHGVGVLQQYVLNSRQD
jgi:hypothetical protein